MGLNKFCDIMSEFLPQRAQLSHQIYAIRFCDKNGKPNGFVWFSQWSRPASAEVGQIFSTRALQQICLAQSVTWNLWCVDTQLVTSSHERLFENRTDDCVKFEEISGTRSVLRVSCAPPKPQLAVTLKLFLPALFAWLLFLITRLLNLVVD